MAARGRASASKDTEMAHTAKHKFARISPTKARPVAAMIRGLVVTRALEKLEFSPKRAARMVEKVLRSALANAGVDADAESMFVQDVRVDNGPVAPGTKRWMPVARGTAHPIRKRTSHISVTIEELSAEEET